VSNLGCGIDQFQVDLLHIFPLVVGDEWCPKNDWAFAASHARTFDDQELVLDLTIMGKSSEWGDWFDGAVGFSRSLIFDGFLTFGFGVSFSDSVDFLVDLDTVMVTFLTTSGNSV